jgi:hypothetical protein
MTPHSCSRIAPPQDRPCPSRYARRARQTPGDWHVQWTDDDGGFEMAIFSGPRARERAVIFAERCYGSYEEVRSHQG